MGSHQHQVASLEPIIVHLQNESITTHDVVSAVDMLERLMRFNAADRLTAEEALYHPYMMDLSCPFDEHVVSNPFSVEHEVSKHWTTH